MGCFSAGYGRGLVALVLLLQAAWVWAHAPGLSSLDVALKSDLIEVRVTFALQDIEAFSPMDSDLDAEVSDSEREAAKPGIAQLLAGQLRIAVDGDDVTPVEPGQVSFDGQNNAHVQFRYPAVPKQQLLVQSTFLALLPDGHQQYLIVRDANGKALAEKMLVKQDDRLSLPFAGAADGRRPASTHAVLNTVSDFFKLGIEHIVTGYDHLLFLLALLVVTHSFWPALKIITFFTLAHSLTLALAGLNLVDLPSSFVEPFIAATIIYVGVENLIRGDHPKGRHWLTFGFGLIHGFGFAGALREMEITSGDTGILLPLVSFNLGIESGQIAVAAVVLPMIWWLNNKVAIAGKFLKGCSIAVSLMGTYWLLERTVL
ncbi:MAG: HupE/UreJ family protein [Methylomonas sp.]|jgi:hydrogenase/urease accessory protein HupE|uniref:HupE/UreJ family protein n=1 Tax=Methylomonas sp. TaxID=418 RepID=UPI0026003A9F|nr:HupE/UreJ family protein [Methylomonas sp.]MCK9606648.1 HupE/UreJ family protein [Methylomonas sp.]